MWTQINNCLNKVYPTFDRPHKELSSEFCLIDSFSDWFCFYTVNYKDNEVTNAYFWTLNKIFEDFFSNPNTILIISDASIKKNVATSILHIFSNQNVITKITHYAINITSMRAELFLIRCGINQAI